METFVPDAVDYDCGWRHWDDMVRYSPAPYHRRRLIVVLASRLSFETALDVGCGNGETLAALGARFPADYTGIDLSSATIEANQRRFPAMRFTTLAIESGALDETFELVVCSEVIEHCADAFRALVHLRRMVGRDLILTVPTGPVFPIDRAMGHHKHFRVAELTSLLTASGFEVCAVRRWGFPFHSLYKILINVRAARTMHTFAEGRYGIAQKAESPAPWD